MSDDRRQNEAELDLFDEDSETSEPTADLPEISSTKSTEGIVTSSATKQREKQVEVWTDRVLKGEADIDNLPKSLEWLKPLVTERINANDSDSKIEALVDKRLAERSAKDREQAQTKEFQSIRADLNALDLLPEEKAEVVTEYKSFMDEGLNPTSALRAAKKLIEAKIKAEADMREIKRARMKVGSSNTKAVTNENVDISDPKFFKQGDSKSRVAYLEKMARGGR